MSQKQIRPHCPSVSPELMLARLQAIFSNHKLCQMAKHDLFKVLRAIGYSMMAAHVRVDAFVEEVLRADSLEALETHWNKAFQQKAKQIENRLAGRAEIVFNQVFPHIRGRRGEADLKSLQLLDFGTGDGQIAQMLRQSNVSVTGIDVVDYRVPSAKINFLTFDGHRAPFADESFDVVLATNVLHHEADNELAEREIARLLKTGGKFVVIETVPVGPTEKALAQDFERTFVGDYFYNRILHAGANVPVPGTYETADGWKQRFSRWAVMQTQEDLGIDIPVIQDYHWLGVFRKK